MLGIGFWSMAKVAKRSHAALNRHLIISGFGFFLLFTSNQAILMSIAPYPPFGIATITVMGLSAYLIVIGIYMSTISLSQDAELRRSIKRIARSQSKLFDSMVTVEIEKEIESRVIEVFKKQSVQMEEEETGVEPSLNEQEIHDYLNEVIKEVKR
jgi:ABC-type multidrug transport system fused ATPase/permease subunit